MAPAGLFALLFLLRLLVPSGYMIAPDESGRPALTLCGGAGTGAAVARGHDHHHGGRPASRAPSKPAEPPCPFAALSAPPLPPAPVILPTPAPAGAAPSAAAPLAALSRPALAAPPPPATGPPLSV
jgi:hypothetical protein